MKKAYIGNTSIDNISFTELITNLKQGGVVFTPNVDHLAKIQKDTHFAEAYKRADYRVCDSQILLWLSRFLGQPLQEKISGSDLFPAFCQHYKNDSSVKVFLLGGPAGVADQAKDKINQKLGREIVTDAYSPPFGFEKSKEESQKTINLVNQSEANVLAVGLGAPKQEKWIVKHRSKLKNVKTFLALGATIEFEAGSRDRAPKWMSQAGLEWLYRLKTEPKRLWKRYLLEGLPVFLLIFKQKLQLSLTKYETSIK